MRYKALFLDVGWTLIHPERSLWEALADVAGQAGIPMSAGDCEAGIYPLWQGMQERAVSAFRADAEYSDSEEEFVALFRQLGEIVLAGAGVTDPSGEVVEHFMEWMADWDRWHVFAEVPEVLASFKNQGYILAAVSNATPDLSEFLDHLGLARFFDVILASAAEGIKKPDRRLFERAMERTGVGPGEAFHVGDLPLEDVLGARNVGVPVALIHRGPMSLFPSFPPELPPAAAGTPVLSDLTELPALLGGNRQNP